MRVRDAVVAAGFWIGTLLPVAYLPVFVVGIESATMLSIFLALLGLNCVALVVGRGYSEPQSR